MGHEYIAAVIYKYLQDESLSGEEQLALDQWLTKAKITGAYLNGCRMNPI